MIESLNHFSQYWADILLTATIQNSVYLLMIISILYLLRNINAGILRIIALFGLIKLFIPPFISSSLIQELNFPTLTNLPLMTIIENTSLSNNTVVLTIQSKLMIIWILTATFILLVSAINTYRFRSKFRQATFTDISDYYSGSRNKNIQFYTSLYHHSPIVFGCFKIKVILPRDWEEWSNQQKKTVINHELNHVNQFDHWINILKLIAFSVHFFNPFVWILFKKLDRLNELVCDDSTIAGTKTSAIDYTKQLLQFSESYANKRQPMPSALTFTDSYKSLKNRLSYHLSKQEGINMHTNDDIKRKIVIILCIIAMIPLLGQCNKEEPVSTGLSDDVTTEAKSSESTDLLYSYDQLTVKPEMTHKEQPTYPINARKNGISGMVVLTVTINEMGDVIEAKVLSSDNSILDSAALEAAKKCKFKPAEMNGQQVKVSFNLPYKFALK